MNLFVIGFAVLYVSGLSHGLNNKRQKPKDRVCTDLGSIVNCNSYAKCMYKSHCKSAFFQLASNSFER